MRRQHRDNERCCLDDREMFRVGRQSCLNPTMRQKCKNESYEKSTGNCWTVDVVDQALDYASDPADPKGAVGLPNLARFDSIKNVPAMSKFLIYFLMVA